MEGRVVPAGSCCPWEGWPGGVGGCGLSATHETERCGMIGFVLRNTRCGDVEASRATRSHACAAGPRLSRSRTARSCGARGTPPHGRRVAAEPRAWRPGATPRRALGTNFCRTAPRRS
eukprot:355151-Chlamydomonas_euryale.AAC.9